MNLILQLFHKLNRLRCFITRPITVGVRVLLVRESQVVLVKHSYESLWYIPGGGVKKNETVEQAMRREAAEEVGATLGDVRLFGVYTNFYEYKSDHVIVFICEDFSIQDHKSFEIEQIAFFPCDALPANVSPGCRRRIEEYQRGQRTAITAPW